jgi:hypothetical protein
MIHTTDSTDLKLQPEQVEHLRCVIRDCMPPAHCAGCDEWGCGGYERTPEWGAEYTERMLKAVLGVVEGLPR